MSLQHSDSICTKDACEQPRSYRSADTTATVHLPQDRLTGYFRPRSLPRISPVGCIGGGALLRVSADRYGVLCIAFRLQEVSGGRASSPG